MVMYKLYFIARFPLHKLHNFILKTHVFTSTRSLLLHNSKTQRFNTTNKIHCRKSISSLFRDHLIRLLSSRLRFSDFNFFETQVESDISRHKAKTDSDFAYKVSPKK